jgi:hypothetical protein
MRMSTEGRSHALGKRRGARASLRKASYHHDDQIVTRAIVEVEEGESAGFWGIATPTRSAPNYLERSGRVKRKVIEGGREVYKDYGPGRAEINHGRTVALTNMRGAASARKQAVAATTGQNR